MMLHDSLQGRSLFWCQLGSVNRHETIPARFCLLDKGMSGVMYRKAHVARQRHACTSTVGNEARHDDMDLP